MNKFLIIFFLLLGLGVLGQKNVDSIIHEIENSQADDSVKINKYLTLISDLESFNPDDAINLALKTVDLSIKSNFKTANSLIELAYLKFLVSDFKESLKYYQMAENEATKILKLRERDNLLANIYSGMAFVYSQIKNHKSAINSLKKAKQLYASIDKPESIAICDYNLGNILYRSGDLDNSLNQFYLAEKNFLNLRDSLFLINVYNSIGSCLKDKKDLKGALVFFEKSFNLTFKHSPTDSSSIAIGLQNIGETYGNLNNNIKAKEYLLKAKGLFLQLNDKTNLSTTYFNLADTYVKLEEFEAAADSYKKYVQLKDSIFDEDTKQTIHEISVKYETEKKEKENQVLTLENKNKKQVIYFAFGGCALLLGLVFFIFRGYRNKQKANLLLAEKNSIISHQKEIVEEQHQEITDSIKYAQRIQGAILPPRNLWQKMLPNSFVLYMPKDVLSGDFYWIEETKDYIYVAAADCTGHGVPGALISIVNYNLLNKAILEQNLVTPSEILDAVNTWLTVSLHQTYRESAVRDGMDVSLIAIHKHSNEILFAGANNPIYIVTKGELKQIKGDKFPVGAFVEDQIQKFTTKSIKVNKGDCIYLFSDGFADQFGGDNGKKYKYAPFQQKLISIADMDLSQQRLIMKEDFMKWKGLHEQVDDVLLVGIKIA